MIAEDAKRLAAQLDTVFEDVQMMWFDGSREPVVVAEQRAGRVAQEVAASLRQGSRKGGEDAPPEAENAAEPVFSGP